MTNELTYQTILKDKRMLESRWPGLRLETRNKTPDSIYTIYDSTPIAQIYKETGFCKSIIPGKMHISKHRSIEVILDELQKYYK
jgi:hypothetical protein